MYTTVLSFDIVAVDEINFNSIQFNSISLQNYKGKLYIVQHIVHDETMHFLAGVSASNINNKNNLFSIA